MKFKKKRKKEIKTHSLIHSKFMIIISGIISEIKISRMVDIEWQFKILCRTFQLVGIYLLRE